MVKIGKLWKHRCTCGAIFSTKDNHNKFCIKCTKEIDKKLKDIKEENISTIAPASTLKRFKSCHPDMAEGLSKGCTLEEFMRLPDRPNPYYNK